MRRWWVAEDEARWDTRSHKDGEPRRRTPGGKPYMPWHDSTMILAGPVGEALADLGNERWQRATKKPLRDLRGVGENWPDELDPDFRDRSEGRRVGKE